MNSIYVPGVALLRRMFNAFSALSISNQYLIHHGNTNPEEHSSVKTGVFRSWRRSSTSSSNHEATSNASPEPEEPPEEDAPPGVIQQLMYNPTLYEPLRRPRYPIVLCHGLYGFDVIGPETFPSLRMHYWHNVLSILRNKLGAEVIVCSVPGTGSIAARAHEMHRQLKVKARGRGVNFFAHSMGGLDCRHLITHIQPTEYTPLSLTSIATPHRGSPFMDWCADNIGIGKINQREELLSRSKEDEEDEEDRYHKAVMSAASPTTPEGSIKSPDASNADKKDASGTSSFSLSTLPSAFTTLLLSTVDSPAYANLTTTYLQDVFNPNTPDNPRVKYFSVAGRVPPVNVWHPFWLPKLVLDGVEEKERAVLKQQAETQGSSSSEKPLWAREEEWGNDGLVTIQSAKWGQFLGIVEGADHWEIRGARGLQPRVDSLPLLGSSDGADGWGFNLSDWGRFIGAWKPQAATTIASIAADKTAKKHEDPPSNPDSSSSSVIKTSTDKLSSVFDWLVEHVPGSGDGHRAPQDGQPPSEMKKHMDRVGSTHKRRKNELETMEDLERFYLALSRKLYDEGL